MFRLVSREAPLTWRTLVMHESRPSRYTSGWFDTLTLLATVVVFQCACAPWHMQFVIPPAATPFDSTKTYRVTLGDGRRLVAYHPRVLGDSLTWTPETAPDAPRSPQQRRGIPLADIHAVEVEASNAYAALLVLLVGVGMLGAVAAASSLPH